MTDTSAVLPHNRHPPSGAGTVVLSERGNQRKGPDEHVQTGFLQERASLVPTCSRFAPFNESHNYLR